jgi:hypothetical protein
MSTDPAARDRAMGLVKAAGASWISTSPSMSGKDEQHQEYVELGYRGGWAGGGGMMGADQDITHRS